jgi:hypothetical protein
MPKLEMRFSKGFQEMEGIAIFHIQEQKSLKWKMSIKKMNGIAIKQAAFATA